MNIKSQLFSIILGTIIFCTGHATTKPMNGPTPEQCLSAASDLNQQFARNWNFRIRTDPATRASVILTGGGILSGVLYTHAEPNDRAFRNPQLTFLNVGDRSNCIYKINQLGMRMWGDDGRRDQATIRFRP